MEQILEVLCQTPILVAAVFGFIVTDIMYLKEGNLNACTYSVLKNSNGNVNTDLPYAAVEPALYFLIL
jgi:hypothetical protein